MTATLKKQIIERLINETRFTEREIKEYFSNAGGTLLDRGVFRRIAEVSGIRNTILQDRVWDLFDADNDGNVETEELILTLSKLLRGDVADVSECFFELYDIDHDRRLDVTEVMTIAELFWDEIHHEKLSETQKARIADFLKDADENQDRLISKEEFKAAIKQAVDQKASRTKITFYAAFSACALFFLTGWFEMGTSFGLPSMGALALQLKQKLGIDDAAIGALTGYYYIAAVVGPLVGGYFIDKIGPAPVLAVSNVLVAIGAVIQAIAADFPTLVAGRLIMGLGGEVTAFATIEILAILFPSKFMLMCGLRNLVQSSSCFLAFIILPWLAKTQSTNAALWFIVIMGVVSLGTSAIVWFYIWKRRHIKKDVPSAAAMLKAFATKMVPRLPKKGLDFKLPSSFFVAIFGIKAFYIPLFSFTAFSIEIFTGPKFGMSIDQAAFMSGFISLLAGLSGPFFGPLSDYLGRRSISCAVFMAPAVVAFCLFAWFESVSPWVGITLLAITYGFGDTCAFVSIRLIVGEKKAGIGYGMYSVIGNLISFVVPILGGYVIKNYGHDTLLVYFAAIMLLAVVCWIIVRILEGPNSALELPAKDLIETKDDVVDTAAMVNIARGGK